MIELNNEFKQTERSVVLSVCERITHSSNTRIKITFFPTKLAFRPKPNHKLASVWKIKSQYIHNVQTQSSALEKAEWNSYSFYSSNLWGGFDLRPNLVTTTWLDRESRLLSDKDLLREVRWRKRDLLVVLCKHCVTGRRKVEFCISGRGSSLLHRWRKKEGLIQSQLFLWQLNESDWCPNTMS